MDLTIDVKKEGAITVLSVGGELDNFHAPKLSDALSDVIESSTDGSFVLDMEKTTFIDSVGLGTVAIAGKKMLTQGGHVHMVTSQPQIVKLIKESGILDALQASMSLHANLEQAKAALNAQ